MVEQHQTDGWFLPLSSDQIWLKAFVKGVNAEDLSTNPELTKGGGFALHTTAGCTDNAGWALAPAASVGT